MKRRGLITAAIALFCAVPIRAAEIVPVAGCSSSYAAAPVEIPILVYHNVAPYDAKAPKFRREFDVDPPQFARELLYLKNEGYAVLSFDQAATAIGTCAWVPEKSVVLTFDDGLKDQARYALPILRRQGMTATFFVIAGEVGTGDRMSWDDVVALKKAGMDVGAHSMTHPHLTAVYDDHWLEREIAGSKRLLEEKTGGPVTAFAYPFGLHDTHVEQAVWKAGFRAARTTDAGAASGRDGLYRLRASLVFSDFPSFLKALGK